MTDISYSNWAAMTDSALLGQVGAFIRHHRLQQNKSQQVLAHQAGISRSTLSLLERGETVTLATLIQTLRVLGQLQVMDAFAVTPTISPLALVKAQKEKKLRAGSRHNQKQKPK